VRVYLDHAATSPMPEAVLTAYVDELRRVGNPASTHGHGQEASERLEAARERIAAHLGCDRAEVTLTGGGTEAINTALKGMFWSRRDRGFGPVVLIAEGEHHATLESAEWLERSQGAEVRWLPLTGDGALESRVLEGAIHDVGAERVAFASFLWANNEVGTVQPVAELAAVARNAGIPVHVDAVAALGQLPIDFRALGIDTMSVSAHKIGGPVGAGALVISRTASLEPLMHGGSQQRGRSGTQDVAGAVAFASALELGATDFAAKMALLASRRNRLIEGVRSRVPGAALRGSDPATCPEGRLPGNAHFTFAECQGDSLVFLLDAAGISASVGSACQAGVASVSHVLLAMGVPETEARGALRFTLSTNTTDSEIDALLEVLPSVVAQARSAGQV